MGNKQAILDLRSKWEELGKIIRVIEDSVETSTPPVKPAETPPVTPGLPAGFRVYKDLNFRSGQIPGDFFDQSKNSGSYYSSIVELPWGGKGCSLKLVPGTSWEGKGYPRSELMVAEGKGNSVEWGKEYIFSFSCVFKGPFVDTGSEMLAPFQIHHDGGGTIPVAMYMKSGRLQLAVRESASKPKWFTLLRRVEVDKRYDFLIGFKGDLKSGYVDVTINNTRVASHTGQVGYANTARVGYPKIGLYDFDNVVKGVSEMIFDGLLWLVK